MYVNYGAHCTPDHPWKQGSPPSRFLLPSGLGSGGCQNPVKPFNVIESKQNVLGMCHTQFNLTISDRTCDID